MSSSRRILPICKDCGGLVDIFMLTEELWLSLCDTKEDLICLPCVEERLGRSLSAADLLEEDPPCNRTIKYLLETRSPL